MEGSLGTVIGEMNRHLFAGILLFFTFITSLHPVQAIQGGNDATGDERVVAITNLQGQRGCSGALVSPRIVYTAAHCLYRARDASGSTYGVEIPNGSLPSNSNLYVTSPGTKAGASGGKRARVIAQFSDPKYQDSNTPIVGFPEVKFHFSLWDFGVLILEVPLSTKSIRIATLAEIEQAIHRSSEATVIGYGCKSYEEQDYSDARPTKSSALIRNEIFYQDQKKWMAPYPTRLTLNTKLPVGVFMGGGDSGSPLFIRVDDEQLYVGALSAGEGPNACSAPDNTIWKDPFWSVNASGSYYTAQAFPGVIARAEEYLVEVERRELEVKSRNDVELAIARLAQEQLKAKQEAEAKAAAELRAKQEAEEKAAAELKARQEAEAAALAAAAKKKVTITCVKGKLTKKVTAVKPKCPKGYKKQ